MRSCSVCKRKYETGNGNLFTPPKNIDERKMWIEICGVNIGKNSLICSNHFLSASIIKVGKKSFLLPNAKPIARVNYSTEVSETSNVEENTNDSDCIIIPPSKDACFPYEYEPEYQPDVSESTDFENQKEIFTPNLLNVIPPQLQEEPIMQISAIKPVCCTGSTQTNTRMCGLVQATGYSGDFRFICFYCSKVFPLEKWKSFITHLTEEHLQIQALKMYEYVSDDHDYTSINSSPPTPPVVEDLENVIIKAEPASILEDPLKPTLKSFDSMVHNPNTDNVQDENYINTCSSNNLIETDNSTIVTPNAGILHELNYARKEPKYCSLEEYRTKIKSRQISNKTALSRCLKRTNALETIETEEREECNTDCSDIVHHKPTEITFQYTPREIVDLLLDSMKNYPVLWQYDYGPFNEGFYDAVENLCKIVNEKWSLNIDNLTMRRSINRMIRFYCCLFPNTNNENVDKFTSYYDKFAEFLPSSVHEIPYARCSHCYVCYKTDFDLRRHLLDEYKYLQWPYKCTICEECFRYSDEYEFHNLLPHYDEIFRCERCKKIFNCYFTYKNHMLKHHPKAPRNFKCDTCPEIFNCYFTYRKHMSKCHPKEPRQFKCNTCSEIFDTNYKLRTHKFQQHEGKKFRCHMCPKSYYLNSKLQLHLKRHRKELDFICEVCGKAFLIGNNLRQHMKMHTGTKINCSICNIKLRKSSLNQHLRVTHVPLEGTIEQLFRTGKERRNVSKRHFWPKEHKRMNCYCNICDINFGKRKLIVEHNKKFHSDKLKWQCKICSSEFIRKVNLKLHYRGKHRLHRVQVYKIVEDNEDLKTVLDMDMEYLDELTNNPVAASKKKTDKLTETITRTPIKSDVLPDEIYFETENVPSSTIQDKILEADDENVLIQEVRIEFFTDFSEEVQQS